MKIVALLALMLVTWAVAFALVPLAVRTRGEWPLFLLLALGSSGSIAAVLLVG